MDIFANGISDYTMREGISALEREENVSTPGALSILRSYLNSITLFDMYSFYMSSCRS